MWKSILNGDNIKLKLEEIDYAITTSCNNLNKGGALNGLAGVALFYSLFDKYKCPDSYSKRGEETLTRAFELVTRDWHSPTYCSGFPGIAWVSDYLEENGMINFGFDSSSVDEYAETMMFEMAQNKNLDFFHGSLGIFYYLISKKNVDTKMIDKYIEILNSQSIKCEDGSMTWESLIINGDTRVMGRNFSLSHGMASLVVVLSKLFKKRKKSVIAVIIRGALEFMEKYKNEHSGNLSLYPSYILDDNMPLTYKSRLGWCYGDLCLAIAYLNAGINLNDDQFKQTAFAIFKHASYRRDLETNYIKDAGFCHGAAGIGHIYSRAYNYYKYDAFRETALFWLNETLTFGTNQNSKTAGFLNFTPEGFVSEINFLEGISGIGAVLLSAFSNTEPKWDSIFLLS